MLVSSPSNGPTEPPSNGSNVPAPSFFNKKRHEYVTVADNGIIDMRPDLQRWKQSVFDVYDELKRVLMTRARHHPTPADIAAMQKLSTVAPSNETDIPTYRKIMSDIFVSIGMPPLGPEVIIETTGLVSIPGVTNVSARHESAPADVMTLFNMMHGNVPQQHVLSGATQRLPQGFMMNMMRCCDGCRKSIDPRSNAECHCSACGGDYDLCDLCKSKGLSPSKCPPGYQCGKK